jgi:hypothetical protein
LQSLAMGLRASTQREWFRPGLSTAKQALVRYAVIAKPSKVEVPPFLAWNLLELVPGWRKPGS